MLLVLEIDSSINMSFQIDGDGDSYQRWLHEWWEGEGMSVLYEQ